MCNVTFQTFLLLMNTIVTKAKILKNQNVDISNTQDGTGWLAAENIQKIQLFLFSKLAKEWLKDGQGMEDQEERMKNKKYKMFPSDIILKFKNIVKFN